MRQLPIIRIQLQTFAEEVQHAFVAHNAEIEQIVAEEMKRAIEGFDYRKEVQTIVRSSFYDAINKQLSQYLLYGDGREIINTALAEHVGGVLKKAIDAVIAEYKPQNRR